MSYVLALKAGQTLQTQQQLTKMRRQTFQILPAGLRESGEPNGLELSNLPYSETSKSRLMNCEIVHRTSADATVDLLNWFRLIE
jgi:hypothetical protein